MESMLANVPITDIDMGDRARNVYRNIDSLANSIKTNGLIQPIAIMMYADAPNSKTPYLLLAGGRRMAAFKQMKWETVPTKIFPYLISKKERKAVELIENIEREDLTPAEHARLVRDIHELHIAIKGERKQGEWSKEDAHSIADTAALLNVSDTQIRREMELANAYDADPELEQLKNKSEVLSKIAKDKEGIVVAEMAKRAVKKALKTVEDPKSELLLRYHNIDILDFMKAAKAETYHLIELDPPYLIELRKVVKTTAKEDELLRGNKMSDEEIEESLLWLQEIFTEAYRIATPNSWILCWLAMDPWISVFAEMIRHAGWIGGMVPALWVKNNGNTRTPNIHLSNYYEPCLYMKKGNAMLAKPGAPNIFRLPVIPSKIHPNEKPIELYMDMFRTFANPGARILSGFVGSGNAILAGANVDMHCEGIDINEDYYKYFVARVQEGKPGEYKSYRGL